MVLFISLFSEGEINKISKRSLERDGIEGETPVCVKRRMSFPRGLRRIYLSLFSVGDFPLKHNIFLFTGRNPIKK